MWKQKKKEDKSCTKKLCEKLRKNDKWKRKGVCVCVYERERGRGRGKKDKRFYKRGKSKAEIKD